MIVSLREGFVDGLFGVIEPRFHGADGDAEQDGHFVEGEFVEEEKGENFALRERKAIEGVVDLFGVVEGKSGVGLVVGDVLLGVLLGEFGAAEVGDGGVAGGAVEECGEGAGVADGVDGAKGFEPGFLQEFPGDGFGGGESAEVVEEGFFPEFDEAFEGGAVAALVAGEEEGGFDELSILRHGGS
jgi:hypothetical protein